MSVRFFDPLVYRILRPFVLSRLDSFSLPGLILPESGHRVSESIIPLQIQAYCSQYLVRGECLARHSAIQWVGRSVELSGLGAYRRLTGAF